MQSKLISKKDKLPKDEDLIKYLEGKGYCVQKLSRCSDVISDTHIINFFYEKLREVTSKAFLSTLIINEDKDRKALAKIHKKAKSIGFDKTVVNKEVYKSLVVLFEYYNSLELQSPPGSLEYVLSKHGMWMIQKALSVKESEKKNYVNSEEFKKKLDELCNIESNSIKLLIAERHKKLKEEYKDGKKGKEGKK